jgi:hypothetical protein
MLLRQSLRRVADPPKRMRPTLIPPKPAARAQPVSGINTPIVQQTTNKTHPDHIKRWERSCWRARFPLSLVHVSTIHGGAFSVQLRLPLSRVSFPPEWLSDLREALTWSHCSNGYCVWSGHDFSEIFQHLLRETEDNHEVPAQNQMRGFPNTE